MKKKLLVSVLLFAIIGSFGLAYADDDDYDDDDHNHRYYHSRYYKYDDDDDYQYWRSHGDYDRWKERRYKNWYSRCSRYSRYGNIRCSYSNWNYHRDWDDDQWHDYWRPSCRDAQKCERMRHKMYALHNVLDATRTLFW